MHQWNNILFIPDDPSVVEVTPPNVVVCKEKEQCLIVNKTYNMYFDQYPVSHCGSHLISGDGSWRSFLSGGGGSCRFGWAVRPGSVTTVHSVRVVTDLQVLVPQCSWVIRTKSEPPGGPPTDTFSTADLVGKTRGTLVHTLAVIRVREYPAGPEGTNISMLSVPMASDSFLLWTIKLKGLNAVC